MSMLRGYHTLAEFRQEEPQLSQELYRLAKQIEHGFDSSNGHRFPSWFRAPQFLTRMLQPTHDGSRKGADPLQVKHALQEYIRKPEKFVDWPDGPWGLMQHIVLDHTTAVRVEEIRWGDFKKQDKLEAGRNLESVGALLGRAIQAGMGGAAAPGK